MNNKINYIQKYKKYKAKYLELKILYGGEEKKYKILGFYTENDNRIAYEFISWDKFIEIEKTFTITYICCECSLDKTKILIRLSNSESPGSDRIEYNADMSIYVVSEFTHRFSHIPRNPQASIIIDKDIDFRHGDYSCQFFKFSHRGKGYDEEGNYEIKKEEFKINPIQEPPLSLHLAKVPEPPLSLHLAKVPEYPFSPRPSDKIWGFEYQHKFVKKGKPKSDRIFYSDENQINIQNAIILDLPSIRINHIDLTGQYEGKSFIHHIDLKNNIVYNETTGVSNKFIYKPRI